MAERKKPRGIFECIGVSRSEAINVFGDPTSLRPIRTIRVRNCDTLQSDGPRGTDCSWWRMPNVARQSIRARRL